MKPEPKTGKGKYFVVRQQDLIDDDDEPYGYFFIEPVKEDDLEWPWLHGERFNGGPATPIHLKVDPDQSDAGGVPDYASGPIPLVTHALRNVLDKCGVSNIDYYPVKVKGGDELEGFPEYFAINIIGAVEAAGPGTKSSKTLGTKGADLVKRFVLKPDMPKDLHVFRLAEHLSTVVVSDRVAKACEAANIDTLWFQPIEEWTT